MRRPRSWILLTCSVGLFAVWSNSFIAISFLLGSDAAPARFGPVGLTVARFVPAGLVCALYCFLFRRREALLLLRNNPLRLMVCGFLMVPGYNLMLYYGQQQGVPAPIASLTTALVPLMVMVLAAVFLKERPTARKIAGFAVAAIGMAVIGMAKKTGLEGSYPLLIGIVSLAPLCWSVYSVISKPMMGQASPIVWSFMGTAVGTLYVVPLLPGRVYRDLTALDGPGWTAVLYLAFPCTVLGFAVWTWLLRFLPASTVGFTVFMNPPFTTTSKFLLATLFPATFLFTIQTTEWAGGLLAMAGLAIAVYSPATASAKADR